MVQALFRGVSCPQPPTFDELTLVRSGDNKAAAALLSRWEPIVQASARRRTKCMASREDVAQAGRLAVLAAAGHYNVERGQSFNHYASRAISNETLKEALRLQTQSECECGLDAALGVSAPNSRDRCGGVREWISGLPRILIKVFVLLYRFGLTQREAAARLRVSQPRICQLHTTLIEHGQRDLAGLGSMASN